MRRITGWAAGLATLLGAAAPGQGFEELPAQPPPLPDLDLTFLTARIPAHALGVDAQTGDPTLLWDYDGDGFAELKARWNPEEEEFTRWEVIHPVTERVQWQVEMAGPHTRPWRIIWDQNGDGVMDWSILDADRDGNPDEIVWEAGRPARLSARFIDRDHDGTFEARTWQRFDEATLSEDRVWAFDEDGDGTYEREIPGSELTPSGYDPEALQARLASEEIPASMRWELLGWLAAQGEEERWREQLLLYAADPEGGQIYRLLQEPQLRHSFHTDREFRDALITALRQRAQHLNEDYVVLWTLGELLRWRSTPPAVHPMYLADWCAARGISPEVLPTEVITPLAEESGNWFLRSLASERITRQARESVAFRLARLSAAEGNWELVEDLCGGMARDALRTEGPMSPTHQEYAAICFAYGHNTGARELYGAMTRYWQQNPGDPQRAQMNHVALIRLGVMAMDEGRHSQARYNLIRALDSLSENVTEPDRRLAERMLEVEATSEAAEEYLRALDRWEWLH